METRILRAVPATLEFRYSDHADTPGDVGAATIGIVNAAGTQVIAPGTPATNGGDGVYTFALAAQPLLSRLTATWTFAGGLAWRKEVSVVEGRYFTIAEAQDSHDELASGLDFDSARVRDKRDAVELEIERVAGIAFTRQYARVVVSGSGSYDLQLPVRYVRTVRSASIRATPASTPVPLTGPQLAAIVLDDDHPPDSCTGVIIRTDTPWPAGTRNVIVEVEHGFDSPGADVRAAALRLLYWRLHERNTEVLDHAVSFSASGGVYQLATAGKHRTGIPVVDAVLDRYSRAARDGRSLPASRAYRLQSTRNSVFHR